MFPLDSGVEGEDVGCFLELFEAGVDGSSVMTWLLDTSESEVSAVVISACEDCLARVVVLCEMLLGGVEAVMGFLLLGGSLNGRLGVVL